ncbi:MAG: purine-nucleoside phosphorylase [Firmicutes bacterium]|nr:purine-nucleoside phosphorylase [Bacillota bacterium]
MSKEYERLILAKSYIEERLASQGLDFTPRIGLVLGSGLGGYAANMEVLAEIPYRDISEFPVSTVPGHDGKYIFGYVAKSDGAKVPIVAMKGRVHYYEGYSVQTVVMPIRVMGMLGIESVILTNAAGGINLDFAPGDLMLISDQITGYVPSPLIGPNIEELGTRFPDMSKLYNPEYREIARQVAAEMGIDLKEGVYVQFTGPQFETPSEIKAFRTLGASAVGMSTACEAIAAGHMGLKVMGISCISNMASGILDQPLTHEEVQETADKVAHKFEQLVTGIIVRI